MRKRTDATRSVILAAAIVLFMDLGYAETTMEAIARNARVTKRTVYGYFPDKRTLFAGVIENAAGNIAEANFLSQPIETAATLHDKVYAIGAHINEYMLQPQYIQLQRLVISELPMQKDLETVLDRGITPKTIQALEDVLVVARDEGVISIQNANMTARQFVGGFLTYTYLDGLVHGRSAVVPKLTNQELTLYVDDFMRRITV